MAGYTRQSTGSIINGSPITAPPLNSEFNQVAAAFNATSGHSHDGSTGNSPKINLTTSVSGYLPAVHGGIGGKNKLDATTTPTVTDDNNDGYAPGSLWEDTTTGRIYICVGNSTGAAVWRELVQVNSGTAILPAATDTVDLGNNSTRFQDLFLSGGISASGNVAAGGTMNITGATALGSTLGVTGDTTLVNLSATGTTVINSIDLNSGAIDSTTIGTTTPAAGTFTTLNANTSLVAATADINGGSVDGATIGASTPSTGSFTTLGASGTSTLATVDINGGNIDGTAIGASVQSTGAFTTVSTSGQATLATVDINGGSIDGTAIGANATSSGAFTTLSVSGGITGDIVGNVTGNSSGTHTGAVVGNVTGNLTGNVTSSGTSSFNNVTVDGTLNMNAGTTATITNLTDPTNAQDAATKAYVDGEISTLIGDAGAGLNTLGELADALNDDDDFSTTVTNSIATKLPLAGGTLTGALAMSNNKVTGLGSPSVGTDASTKDYVDTQRNTRVAKTGDTMSGALAMGSNKITGLGTPTAGTDATTKTYVDNILGSATVAATSATNAATSESNAATSATNASNSATAAASSSASAAASLDSFDDRYLGAKSSAPTVDNDGDALIVGALYFDSTAGAMKVYSANGWTNAGSSVNGTTNRYSYTATAGQTVFAATYDAGYVDVFLNGVKQLVGTDVTATSGTSVVFASGTTVNDIVEIVGYGTFVLADHLTQTQSDARYVNLSGDTMTGDLSFGDNNKAIFGAGSDLTIFSDGGTFSYINNTQGVLRIRNTSDDQDVVIQSDNGSGGVTDYFRADGSTGSVKLYNYGAQKLATTSTGVDITGTLTATKLASANGVLELDDDGTHNGIINSPASLRINIDSDNGATGEYFSVGHNQTSIDNNNILFKVQDDGNVGIGTDSPTAVSGTTVLEITGTSGNAGAEIIIGSSDQGATAADLFGGLAFKSIDNNGTPPHYSGIKARAADTYGGANLEFYAGRSNYENNDPRVVIEGPQSVSGEAMRLTSVGDLSLNAGNIQLSGNGSRNLQIGHGRTDNSYAYVDLVGDATYSDYGLRLMRSNGGANTTSQLNHRGTGDFIMMAEDSAMISLRTAAQERIRIRSDGRIVAGTQPNTLVDNARFQFWGTKDVNSSGAREMLSVMDDTAVVSGVDTENGGAINFGGKYHTNGSHTTFATIEGVKANGNNGNYAGDLKFRTRTHAGSSSERMRIDNQGRVTMPYQPTFKAGRTGNYTPGAGNAVVFNDTGGNYTNHHWNVGNHYSLSTGRFTAPVTGTYLVQSLIIFGPSITNGQKFDDIYDIVLNNNRVTYSFKRAEYVDGTTGNGGYYTDHSSALVKMSANEYVWCRMNYNSISIHGNTAYSWFSAYLLG